MGARRPGLLQAGLLQGVSRHWTPENLVKSQPFINMNPAGNVPDFVGTNILMFLKDGSLKVDDRLNV